VRFYGKDINYNYRDKNFTYPYFGNIFTAARKLSKMLGLDDDEKTAAVNSSKQN
jgi:hypothetical protein